MILSNTAVTWDDAYNNAPAGCVLAPMNTAADVAAGIAQITSSCSGSANQDVQAWTALTYDSPPVGGSTSGWVNEHDNSPLINSTSCWAPSEPNNSPSPQTRATLWKTCSNPGLRDVNPNLSGTDLFQALYLCCDYAIPSASPSAVPSISAAPSESPDTIPSSLPTGNPIGSPSPSPSENPDTSPSLTPSLSPSVAPSNCNGAYIFLSNTTVTWDDAYNNAPAGCVLAPMNTVADVAAGIAQISNSCSDSSSNLDVEVGTALTYDSPPVGGSTSGWVDQHDNSPLVNSTSCWAPAEPNNSHGVAQTRATLWKTCTDPGLRDVDPNLSGTDLFKALYLCCDHAVP